MRLPFKIRLDEGVAVLVKQIRQDLIDARLAVKGRAGWWDDETNTIWISKKVSKKRKWKTLRHELIHAINDIHDSLNGGV